MKPVCDSQRSGGFRCTPAEASSLGYNCACYRCIKLWGVYRARATHVDFGMVNNYNLGYYRPSGLPLVSKMPPVSDLYSEQSTSPVPKQGTLAQIASHERWLRCLAACEQLDAEMDDPSGVKHRQATRFIAVSQFASGAWLDLCPDGRHLSKITRRFLPRRCSAATATTFPAPSTCTTPRRRLVRQSPPVCGRATSLQTDRRTFRASTTFVNGTMYATANMVRARACGKLVLGDKANPQTTFHINEGHVTVRHV